MAVEAFRGVGRAELTAWTRVEGGLEADKEAGKVAGVATDAAATVEVAAAAREGWLKVQSGRVHLTPNLQGMLGWMKRQESP